MKLFISLHFLFLLLFTARSYADSDVMFIGGGFLEGQQTLSSPGNADSKFSSQGSELEGGVTFQNKFQMSAEFGAIKSANARDSETYFESASLKYYSAKAGFNFGRLALGLGYRHNDITIKSLSTTSGYLESNYSGFSPMGHLSLNFEIARKIRTTLEAQYVAGTLKSGNAALPEVKFGEMSLSLKFFLLID